MEKKDKKNSFTDLSDLKMIFSTHPENQPNEEPEAQEEKISNAKQQLRISLDKKHRAGKEVTWIDGLKLSPVEMDQLAKELKSKCGIGGGVSDDGGILLQGDQRKKLPDILKKMGFLKIKVI
jgi:translation initiation factor 1